MYSVTDEEWPSVKSSLKMCLKNLQLGEHHLNSYALCQISRSVRVMTKNHSELVRQNLDRNDLANRVQLVALGNLDEEIKSVYRRGTYTN